MSFSIKLRDAFEVGRLLARYTFFAQQYEMGLGVAVKSLDDTGHKLVIASRKLQPVPRRESFANDLAKLVKPYVRTFDAEWRNEQLLEFWADETHAELSTGEFVSTLERWLSTAFGQRDELTSYLKNGLRNNEILAIELGVRVEEGLCPSDAYRHCFTEDPTQMPRRFRHKDPPSFYPIDRRPGEIPLDPGWLDSVFAIARELGIEKALPDKTMLRDKIQDVLVGFDLRLTNSIEGISDISTSGKRLVVSARAGKVLHFRVFDASVMELVNTDETSLTKQAGPIADLKKRLKKLWPPHELTKIEKDRVLTAVKSIIGDTILEENSKIVVCQLAESIALALGTFDPLSVPAQLKGVPTPAGGKLVGGKKLQRDSKALNELGLQFDEETKLITRDGHKGDVTLGGKKQAHVFAILMRNQGKYVQYPKLREVWDNEETGSTDKQIKADIRQVITTLRAKLSKLSLNIKQQSGLGWVLEHAGQYSEPST